MRERFGGEKEQGGVLKKLRERQKVGKTVEKEQQGGDAKAVTKGEEKPQREIITQPPNLVDGRK